MLFPLPAARGWVHDLASMDPWLLILYSRILWWGVLAMHQWWVSVLESSPHPKLDHPATLLQAFAKCNAFSIDEDSQGQFLLLTTKKSPNCCLIRKCLWKRLQMETVRTSDLCLISPVCCLLNCFNPLYLCKPPSSTGFSYVWSKMVSPSF